MAEEDRARTMRILAGSLKPKGKRVLQEEYIFPRGHTSVLSAQRSADAGSYTFGPIAVRRMCGQTRK